MASKFPLPRLELICAVDSKLGIGLKGVLPWSIPKEFKYYLRMSKKRENPDKPNVAIFGRKTWDSFLKGNNGTPMSRCINVIISRNMNQSEIEKYKDVHIARSLDDAIQMLQNPEFSEKIGRVWVHGGADIYRDAMKSKYFYRLYLSKINKEYDCDVFFPQFDESKLDLVEDLEAPQGLQEDSDVQFQVFIYQSKGDCALLTLAN